MHPERSIGRTILIEELIMSTHRVPHLAKVLGAAGLLPFMVGAGYLLFGPLSAAQYVFNALTIYGAVILSFMGAIHWGLALTRPEHETARWYGIGVVPALLGWGAALVGLAGAYMLALSLLGAGFALVLAVDRLSVSAGFAPRWYLRLRWPLTLVVLVCLAVAGSTFL